MYHKLGTAWASTLLAVLGCLFVPVPFLFYFFGDRIRLASKHALKAPCNPLQRSYRLKTSPRMGGEPETLCIRPTRTVALMPETGVSDQPESSTIPGSAASAAPTRITDAFVEPSTPIPSTLLTPQRAASPVSVSRNVRG